MQPPQTGTDEQQPCPGHSAAAVDDTKPCYCYACEREVNAAVCADQELRCLQCSCTCVELLPEPTQISAPAEQPAPSPETFVSTRRLPRLARRRSHSLIGTRNTLATPVAHHVGVICDGCRMRDFAGIRYRCLRCRDFDLCAACHAQRGTLHPGHPFEAIRTPRPSVPAVLADFVARAASRTVVAFIGMGLEESEERSGLDEACISWWLAGDRRLVGIEQMALEDPAWCCPICSEGLEAEGSSGWVVQICGTTGNTGPSLNATAAAGIDTATTDDTSSNVARIASVPDTDISHGDSEGIDGMSAADDTAERGRGHVYHEACLRKWLLKRNSCPVCRRSPVVPQI